MQSTAFTFLSLSRAAPPRTPDLLALQCRDFGRRNRGKKDQGAALREEVEAAERELGVSSSSYDNSASLSSPSSSDGETFSAADVARGSYDGHQEPSAARYDLAAINIQDKSFQQELRTFCHYYQIPFLEDNAPMTNAMERLGFVAYKTYRLYDRPL